MAISLGNTWNSAICQRLNKLNKIDWLTGGWLVGCLPVTSFLTHPSPRCQIKTSKNIEVSGGMNKDGGNWMSADHWVISWEQADSFVHLLTGWPLPSFRQCHLTTRVAQRKVGQAEYEKAGFLPKIARFLGFLVLVATDCVDPFSSILTMNTKRLSGCQKCTEAIYCAKQ